MASAMTPRIVEATFSYPINANSNPTPVKAPFQGAYTQVAASPPVVQKPHCIATSQDDLVQDSLELPPLNAAHQPDRLPNLFEPHTPIDNHQVVQDSHEAKSLASAPSSQNQPDQQRFIETHPPDQGPSEDNFIDHSIRERPIAHLPSENAIQDDSPTSAFQSTSFLKRTGTSQPEVSASTPFTTPGMAPKASNSQGTSKNKTPANQSQKRVSTCRTSQLPTSEIFNRGETSASALLRKMKSGATSQTDVRRQVLETAPPVAPIKPPKKASARPSQAPTKKPLTKPSQHNLDIPKRQLSRNVEPSEDEIDEYAVPQSDKKKDAKPLRKTKSAALSVPSVNKGKIRSKRQTAKAPVIDKDDDDDEEYQPQKASKSRAAASPERETRASTRAQIEKVTKHDGLKVSTLSRTYEAAKVAERPMPPQPPTSRASRAPEDYEDSVAQVSSSDATRLQPAARQRPAIPPAEKRKPRPVTEKGAKLMHAISSPSQTVPDIATVTTKAKEVSTAEHGFSTPADNLIGKQCATQRHPIIVEDDGDDSDDDDDDDDDLDAGYDDSYNELITREGSQDEPRKQDRPIPGDPFMQSPFKNVSLESMVEERDSRKPHIVAFNDAGPKNQGVPRRQQTGLDRPRAFGKETSPPSSEDFDAHEPPPIDTTVHYDDDPLPKLLGSAVASDIPVHISTVGQVASVELGDSALSKSKPSKTAMNHDLFDVSTPNDMVPSTIPRKAAASGTKRRVAEEIEDPIEGRKHTKSTTRLPSEVTEDLPQVTSRPSDQQHNMPLHKTQEKEVKAQYLTALSKGKTPIEPNGHNGQAASSSKPPAAVRPQTLTTQRDVAQAIQPAQIQPKPDRRTYDRAKPPSTTNAYTDSAEVDRRLEVIASSKMISLPLQKKVKSRPNMEQEETPVFDRKRSAIVMTKEPAKRQRINAQGSHQPPGHSTTIANELVRKPSQVADNGSPIAFGEETGFNHQPRYVDTPLLPAMAFTRGSVVDPFAQIMASRNDRKARKEHLLEEVPSMQQDWPAQASQAVTHAGFDEYTQLTTGFAQKRELKDNQFPNPQRGAPGEVKIVRKSLGFMDALRSEVAPQAGVQDEADKEDSKENWQADQNMEEDDPDKTLVNETSDYGDGDGDDSESGESSDSDDGDKAWEVLSGWRKALELHQANVYDQMVRIAHRLMVHLKDHETAIEDISKDYRQDGAKLIERFDKDNEERLEEYCIKASKMKGALVLGFKQVSGILQRDVKDITMSSDRYSKMLQKQMDASGRLEQIMQAYHA